MHLILKGGAPILSTETTRQLITEKKGTNPRNKLHMFLTFDLSLKACLSTGCRPV